MSYRLTIAADARPAHRPYGDDLHSFDLLWNKELTPDEAAQVMAFLNRLRTNRFIAKVQSRRYQMNGTPRGVIGYLPETPLFQPAGETAAERGTEASPAVPQGCAQRRTCWRNERSYHPSPVGMVFSLSSAICRTTAAAPAYRSATGVIRCRPFVRIERWRESPSRTPVRHRNWALGTSSTSYHPQRASAFPLPLPYHARLSVR